MHHLRFAKDGEIETRTQISKQAFDSDTERVIRTLMLDAKGALKENYVGFYIHGSLCMSGYNPLKSDIDYMIVCHEETSLIIKKALLDSMETVWEDGPAKGLEMHLMCRKDCLHLADEPEFVLHYSAMHRQSYQKDPLGYIGYMHGKDPDLNAHITVMRARGLCYDGRPVDEVFGQVDEKNYVLALLGDLAWNPEEVMYHVLNGARSLAYVRERRILSKREGGIWGIGNLPEYKMLFQDAVACMDSDRMMLPSKEAEEFCRKAGGEIRSFFATICGGG